MRWLIVASMMLGCAGAKDGGDDADPPADTDAPDTDAPDTDVPADTEDPPDTDVPDDTEDPPDTDVVDTDVVDTDVGDTGQAPVDPCRLTPRTATPVTPRDLLPGGVGWIDHMNLFTGTTSARVIQDQAGYDQLAGLLGQRLPPVDFAVETVIFGWRGVTSTCGMNVEHFAVLEIPGTDDVVYQLGIHDSSGGCPIACDMIQLMAKVVAVPKSDSPVTCLRDLDRCP